MKKHVKILFKHHITVWSNFLVEASLQKNAATWLLESNARTTLFHLEAMTYVLATMHDDKKLTKLNERFKLIEDSLGSMDYYAGMLKDFQHNKKIPAHIIAHLEVELQTATFKTNALLHEQSWLGKDASRMDKVKQIMRKVDWLGDADFAKQLHRFYQKRVAKLTEQLAQPLNEIEADVHELRRDVRWLSIYPQAFKGFIALKPARITAQKWGKYLTVDVLNSPFNTLVRVDDITDVLELNANNFYALSWLIAALGTLKDQGLSWMGLTEALRAVSNEPLEHAQASALKMLGAGQANQDEILAAARMIVAQVKKDGVLSGLVVNA